MNAELRKQMAGISDEQTQFFAAAREDPENDRCFECGERHPTWCSLNNGIYLCLACAGKHRGYGVHISFVRSTTLDRFSPLQLAMMRRGGNRRARAYFEAHPFDNPSYCVPFDCLNADAYRRTLRREACAEVGEPYEELPPWRPTRVVDCKQPSDATYGKGTPICAPQPTCPFCFIL